MFSEVVLVYPQQRAPFMVPVAMAYQGTTFALNNGAKIPAIGFGTWQDVDSQEDAVCTALKAGYRYIDTASIYNTESACARGIRKSGIPRSDIFITSKLWNNSHHPDDVEAALDASLKQLDTEYLDLYLMHWPFAFRRGDAIFPKNEETGKPEPGETDYIETWKAMEELVKRGKCRAIGVSNFSKAEMVRLLANCEIIPAVHQLEGHPYLAQHSFHDFHKKKGIHVTHYSPLGNTNARYDSSGGTGIPKVTHNPTLIEIGKKYNKSAAQVALAWAIAQGNDVIPKSKTQARITENLEADFPLDAEDVKKIDALDRKMRFSDPSESFGRVFFAGLDGKEARSG